MPPFSIQVGAWIHGRPRPPVRFHQDPIEPGAESLRGSTRLGLFLARRGPGRRSLLANMPCCSGDPNVTPLRPLQRINQCLLCFFVNPSHLRHYTRARLAERHGGTEMQHHVECRFWATFAGRSLAKRRRPRKRAEVPGGAKFMAP